MAWTQPVTGAPPRGAGRIVGLDVARALALFGMMATHLLPDSVDGETVTWWQQLCGGRAAALFALLAGVSLALVTPAPQTPKTPESPETPEAAQAAQATQTAQTAGSASRRTALRAARVGVAVRAVVIGALGLALGALDTGIAVILTYYAVLFLLGLPFLGLRWRRLALITAGWAVLAPVLSHLLRPALPERIGANPSLGFLTAEPLRLVGELLFTGYYPAVPWMAYLLAGLAIGRLPLHRPKVAAALAATGAAMALAAWGSAWLVLHRLGGLAHLRASAPDTTPFDVMPVDQALVRGTFGTTPTTSWWWLTVAAPHSSTPLDLLHTTGSAMLVVGLCLLATHAAPRALGALFAAGTMTLTLYGLHLVALALDLGPTDGTAALFWWHVCAAALLAALWRATVGRGPLEALTRSASGLARTAVLLLGDQPSGRADARPQGRAT